MVFGAIVKNPQIQDSAFLAGGKAAQTITPLPSPEEQLSLPRLEVATLRDVRAGVMMGEFQEIPLVARNDCCLALPCGRLQA